MSQSTKNSALPTPGALDLPTPFHQSEPSRSGSRKRKRADRVDDQPETSGDSQAPTDLDLSITVRHPSDVIKASPVRPTPLDVKPSPARCTRTTSIVPETTAPSAS